MNKQHILKLFAGLIAVSGIQAASLSIADQQTALDEDVAPRQYTFSWMFIESGTMKPRGGTTSGPEVQLDTRTSEAFAGLQAAGLDDRERDRRAILAMAGDYRTSFDFIETIGFTEGYQPAAPYQSWGTERVYVVANEPEFVSLQHIIVMHFLDADGFESDAMVVKHWRQDWQYEDAEVHTFQGRGAFVRRALDPANRKGAWTQTVYQVDDTPRYSLQGRWEHNASFSAWNSDAGWRPLPRREHSVRSDYDVLAGTNRITVTERGWTHTQDNLKTALPEQDKSVEGTTFLAREIGLNRYERIVGFDFTPADDYWAKTEGYWADVRGAWLESLSGLGVYAIAEECEGRKAYELFFELASERSEAEELKSRGKRKKALAANSDSLSGVFDCILQTAQ